MGRRARSPRDFIDIDGILLLDKPAGLSSNRVLQKVRYLFRANKAGHTGSLDPLATGMLPVCFGEATKFSAFLLDASKSYRARCQLGKTTTTGDAEGEVISEQPANASRQDVEQALRRFLGRIDQIPPMHSAVKVDGQRLYKLARSGREVERPVRQVEIHRLELVEFDRNSDSFVIDVQCSKGTYIRTLAEDIGAALGCGAFLAALRRTGVHPFGRRHCYTLAELEARAQESASALMDCLLPIKSALSDFEDIVVDEAAASQLKQGRSVSLNALSTVGMINLVCENGQFIGIGEAVADGRILPKRLMNTAR